MRDKAETRKEKLLAAILIALISLSIAGLVLGQGEADSQSSDTGSSSESSASAPAVALSDAGSSETTSDNTDAETVQPAAEDSEQATDTAETTEIYDADIDGQTTVEEIAEDTPANEQTDEGYEADVSEHTSVEENNEPEEDYDADISDETNADELIEDYLADIDMDTEVEPLIDLYGAEETDVTNVLPLNETVSDDLLDRAAALTNDLWTKLELDSTPTQLVPYKIDLFYKILEHEQSNILENMTSEMNATESNETILMNESIINETINVTEELPAALNETNATTVDINITENMTMNETGTFNWTRVVTNVYGGKAEEISLELEVPMKLKKLTEMLDDEERKTKDPDRLKGIKFLLNKELKSRYPEARLNPDVKPIKSIIFNDLEIENDTISLGIEELNKPEYVQSYAIDPTQLNFTSAEVTVTAKGTQLYKCKDWNFTTQECYGEWTKLMDIVPGEDYTFTLTPEDPAFAEINITAASHLDENRIFISDIYDKVKEIDDVWSEQIYHNQYVRAEFETELTSENVINFYVRNAESKNTIIEIYEKEGTTLLASTPIITYTGQYDISPTNLIGSSKIFDFKIVNTDGDSSAYLEFDYVHDAPTQTPAIGPDFFMMLDGRASTVGSDGESDEAPISMNDYSANMEKPNTWDCLGWSATAADVSASCYNWTCAEKYGTVCKTYNCTNWQLSTAGRLRYCTGEYDCLSWDGGVCNNWNCSAWTQKGAVGDAYCSGSWNCTEWNGNNCDKWKCTAWTDYTADDDDYYCSGSWDCTEQAAGRQCGTWGCTAWSLTTDDRYDAYCSGDYNCTEFNGDACDKWTCKTWTITGTNGIDHYCDLWNCTTWDSTNKICTYWDCPTWSNGATTDLDYYCTGGFQATSWKILDLTAPLINFTSPTETSGQTLNVNYTSINVTAYDDTLANITIYLYNSTYGLVNSTNSSTSPIFINFTGLANGVYHFNATACDSYGQCNSTETRNITINVTAAASNIIISDINLSFGTIYPLNLYTLLESLNIQNIGTAAPGSGITAKFINYVGSVYGFTSGSNVMNGTNFALNNTNLSAADSETEIIAQTELQPGFNKNVSAKLNVPQGQSAGTYNGTILISWIT